MRYAVRDPEIDPGRRVVIPNHGPDVFHGKRQMIEADRRGGRTTLRAGRKLKAAQRCRSLQTFRFQIIVQMA